jgi:hypothetical protein
MVRLSWFLAVLVLLSACGAFAQTTQPDASRLSNGTVSGNTYHNPDLRFSYEFPKGWAVNDPNRFDRPEHQFTWQQEKPVKGESQPQCSKTLLFVSLHPEGMQTGEFDPMATLTAVDPRCTAGLAFPASINDHQQVQSVGDQIINHLVPPAVQYKTPPQIRAFNNGGRVMLEISRALMLNTVSPQRQNIQKVKASTLVMEVDHFWVIWTFVSGNDGDLNKMRASKIYFDQPTATPLNK